MEKHISKPNVYNCRFECTPEHFKSILLGIHYFLCVFVVVTTTHLFRDRIYTSLCGSKKKAAIGIHHTT